ncbi:MAG TPA: redoxin domain-containing protein [Acidimicrobiales bacterium]|nr:redoxin domain-containing protein [Acidimicrobiales bacterium]
MTGVRRRHTVRWLAAGVLAITAAIVAVLATRPPAGATEVDTPLLGKTAPAVSGATLDGRGFDLESLRGRWVVLNFFASWCPPCQQEEPQLVSFAFHHSGPGQPALVGVVYDDSASGARGFLAQSGATWPAVADPNGQIAIDYGVRGPPETFVISPGGQVVVHLDGAVTEQGLDTWLARAERGET